MSLRRAFFAGLAPAATPVVGPLRRVVYDDMDSFCAFDGAWSTYSGSGWPGGLVGNSLHYCDLVTPDTPLTQLTTSVFQLSGTAGEGIEFYGSNEAGGALAVYIRCLDAANPAWQSMSCAIDVAAQDWTYKGGDPALISNYQLGYMDDKHSQSYYNQLYLTMQSWHGLPAGRYQFRLVKVVNGAAGDNSNNRRTYLDSVQILTCFS